jgi:hypothetical protein
LLPFPIKHQPNTEWAKPLFESNSNVLRICVVASS